MTNRRAPHEGRDVLSRPGSRQTWQKYGMHFAQRRVVRVALLLALTVAVFAVGIRIEPAVARACGTASFSTRGVVKSFGPDRKSVNIAHEKIEGYMAAMTMSFEPREAEQLAGLKVGDTVRFTFTETDDGRRLLSSIKKE
ncbi:MAG TPA: copper-binding protein [Labilithrix sp.]|nr:copper-binding protein [Labilithrix sp.]